MFGNTLAIENPYGISVFGSVVLRVTPDSVLINSAVTRIAHNAAEAFSEAKKGAHAVAEFLRRSNIDDFGTSRISLTSEFRFISGEQRFQGYRATVGFMVKINNLEIFESVITGIVEAGANDVRSIQFQSSDLKDLRSQARARAVQAAREKAANYAHAAGASVGKLIHIQDVNPRQAQPSGHDMMRGSGPGGQDQVSSDIEESASGKQSLDPSAIEVAAAVLVAFKLD
ncbi:MAG: SIMPL domain-containing protein [Terracidiphilus sp.]